MWYSACLIYIVAVKGQRVQIEEDRWLVESTDHDGAYRELNEAGLAVQSSTRTGRERRAASKNTKPHRYRFMGVFDLRTVGTRLLHGIETELRPLSHQPRRRRSARQRLMAFDPAGSGFIGQVRPAQNQRLYEKHRWYLAEQLFRVNRQRSFSASKVKHCGLARMVLIKAAEPDQAFDSSVSNGLKAQMALQAAFVDVGQLSLVTGESEGLWALGTSTYWADRSELRRTLQERAEGFDARKT